MKQKMQIVFLSVCALFALLTMTAYAGAEGDPTVVYVGGVDVSGGGYWKNDGSGGITQSGASESSYNVFYDATRRVLHLNGAKITKTYYQANRLDSRWSEYCGIYADGSLAIELTGENSVDLSGNDTYDHSCAAVKAESEFYSYSALTISGSGNGVFRGGDAGGSSSYGLKSGYSIDFYSTGTLTAAGGNGSSGSYGVYIPYNANDRAAVVRVYHGNITATGAGTPGEYGTARSHGIYGKMFFDREYADTFTAGCIDGQYRSALYSVPTDWPSSSYSMMGSANPDGSDPEVYQRAKNGSYLYVRLAITLPGAEVERGPEYGTVTPYSVTLMNVAISGANPGNQVVEYALGESDTLAPPPNAGWQTSRTFIGLASNMKYRAWARTRATDKYAAGTARYSSTVVTTGMQHVSDYSVYVNGIAVTAANENDILGNKDSFGISTAAYDPNTSTLTLRTNLNTDTINITGAFTDGNGKAIGIFASGDLNIVLDNGVQVNIDLTNVEKDSYLVQRLASKGATLTGNCIGIACGGDLTIRTGAVQSISSLNIKAAGAGIVYGIDCSGKITLDSSDLKLDVRATAASQPQAAALHGQTGIDIVCHSLTAAVDGVDGSSACPAIGTGMFAAVSNTVPIRVIEGDVIAQNLSSGGNSPAMSGKIEYPSYTYSVTDLEGNPVANPTAVGGCKYARLTQGTPKALTGTVTISGAAIAGKTLTASLSDSNSRGGITYTWYRVPQSGDPIEVGTGKTYPVQDADVGSAIQCRAASSVQTGTVRSADTDQVTAKKWFKIWVCGTEITTDNMTNVLGDAGATVSYDAASNTVTLNGVSQAGGTAALIKDSSGSEKILKIKLLGENSVTDYRSYSETVITGYNLQISGPGSLTVSPRSGVSVQTIYAGNDLTISGCAISVTGSKEPLTALGALSLSDRCQLTVRATASVPAVAAGTLTVSGGAAVDAASTGSYGIKTEGSMAVRDGTVAASTGSTSKEALFVGRFTVDSGRVTVSAPSSYGMLANEIAVNGGALEVSSKSNAIYCSALSVNGGSVTASATGSSAVKIYSGANGTVQFLRDYIVTAGTKADGTGAKDLTAYPAVDDYLTYKYMKLTPSRAVPTVGGSVTAGVVRYTVTADSAESGEAFVMIARYDAQGRLKDMQSRKISLAEPPVGMESELFADAVPTDSYRIFLLGDGDYVPLCLAAQVQ